MLTEIRENALINALVGQLPRTSSQLNRLHESDAELIRLPGMNGILAVTTDSLVEEIERGLYEDPYLIGWMTVMINASDLAAVGADPIGILVSETLSEDADKEFLTELQRGIHEACTASGLCVLGGDTNFSDRLQMGGCALGIIADGEPLTRKGCKPGDLLFASGPLGQGSSYAYWKLASNSNEGGIHHQYKPFARMNQGRLLREFATCCMDSSDGALATLDQLMRLNRFGFILDTPLEKILHPDASHLSTKLRIPPWIMLAGPHGEFELIFTVPPPKAESFLTESMKIDWHPNFMGQVIGYYNTERYFGLHQDKVGDQNDQQNIVSRYRDILRFHHQGGFRPRGESRVVSERRTEHQRRTPGRSRQRPRYYHIG
jgi:thiamine-monophosphate kinase